MHEESPSQKEQDIAEEYVNNRRLERPDTDIKKGFKCALLFLATNALGSAFIYAFLEWLGAYSFLPQKIYIFAVDYPTWTKLLIYAIVNFIGFMICFKIVVIYSVRLYQHYAKEELRRRCLFKPTCSEYLILAVQKLGVIKGLYKGYI